MISKLIQTCFRAACCLVLLTGSAYADLILADGHATGSWWNPEREGEGFYIEVVGEGDNLLISVAMYSYDAAGNQLWLVGSTPIGPNDVGAKVPVILVEGPVWGTNYNPADQDTTQFGSIIVRFPSCNSALFDVQSNVAGLESGVYSLQRLTQIVGMDCEDPPPPTQGDVATPGQWTGENICFFINTEPHYGFEPGNRLIESDLCNGNSAEAVIPGVEVNLQGETGPACQASLTCTGVWGITYPGSRSFGWVGCYGGGGAEAEIFFTSPTESIIAVYEYTNDEGTLCVGQGVVTPAQ
jgi:hypothetical protein